MVSKDELTKLSKNPASDDVGRLLGYLVWLLHRGVRRLQNTLRMYGARDFSVVTVSANMPDEKAGVLRFYRSSMPQPQLSLRLARYLLATNRV